MPLRNLLLLIATAVISYTCYVRAEQNPYARYVAAGYSVIDRWSLFDSPDQQLFNGAMEGMIEVLRRNGDEHSRFVNERERDVFREDLTQEFGGVGVRIRLLGEPPLLTIVGPPEPGTPASNADVRSGDRIVKIDGKATAGVDMPELLRMMRGPVGEPVVLTLLHPGQKKPTKVRLVRDVITVESIRGDLRDEQGRWKFRLESDPRIACLRITKFGDKTESEITHILEQLTGQGVQALILDMRDNYGGALDAAVNISDLFLRAGFAIVTTRGREEEIRDRFHSTGRGNYTEIPLAVLINHNSASASEIVAACLQDYGRAVVIGQRSYGKGTVQRLMRIESGRSLLKLSSATYWRPSGRNIHRMQDDGPEDPWGVTPDAGFAVTQTEEDYLLWRKYRHRRDLFGDRQGGPLAQQIDEHDGQLPEFYRDVELAKAVEYLQDQLDNQ